MMKHLIAVLVLALTLATGLLAPTGQARANGIEARLNDSFDAMVNHTPASVTMGNRRGVISGGSLSIRTPVVNIRPFSFRGPSISMGCGGIDAFFGSFSFISKEQLVQAMRAIVTAAITYAFQLALEAMCPTCADILAKIQGWLNQANEFLTNSCEATRNFMDDQKISAAITQTAGQWRDSMGMSKDRRDGMRQGAPTTASAEAEKESGGTVWGELPAKGNQIWNVFQSSGEASFGFAANDFYEEMMSMTGTVVACLQGDTKCVELGTSDGGTYKGQVGELSIYRKPSLMNITALVEGSTASGGVRVYRCQVPVKNCEKMEVVSANFEGMAAKIRRAFLGDETSPGLIKNMRYAYKDAPSPEEERWMKLGGNITGMAFRLAQRDPDLARGFIADNAEAMAAEIIITYIDKYMLSTFVSLARSNQDGLKEAYDLAVAARNQAQKDAEKYYTQGTVKSQFLQAYTLRMDPRVTN